MFKNTFQSGFLSIMYSIGSKPLQIWDKKVRALPPREPPSPSVVFPVLSAASSCSSVCLLPRCSRLCPPPRVLARRRLAVVGILGARTPAPGASERPLPRTDVFRRGGGGGGGEASATEASHAKPPSLAPSRFSAFYRSGQQATWRPPARAGVIGHLAALSAPDLPRGVFDLVPAWAQGVPGRRILTPRGRRRCRGSGGVWTAPLRAPVTTRHRAQSPRTHGGLFAPPAHCRPLAAAAGRVREVGRRAGPAAQLAAA